jgi:hypothetical protein
VNRINYMFSSLHRFSNWGIYNVRGRGLGVRGGMEQNLTYELQKDDLEKTKQYVSCQRLPPAS